MQLRRRQLHLAGHVASDRFVFDSLQQILFALRAGLVAREHHQRRFGRLSALTGAGCNFYLESAIQF